MKISKRKGSDKDELKRMARKKLMERKRLIKESKEDVDSFVKSIIEKFSGWKDKMSEEDVWNDVHDMIEGKFMYGHEDDTWELIKRYSDIRDWDAPYFCYPEDAIENIEDEIFEELGCKGLKEDCGTKKAKDSLKNEKCDDSEKTKESLKKECGDAKFKLRESVKRKLRSKLNEKKNTTDDKLDKEIEELMESNLFRFSKLYK